MERPMSIVLKPRHSWVACASAGRGGPERSELRWRFLRMPSEDIGTGDVAPQTRRPSLRIFAC
jgi:hypothetical protein